MNFGAKIRRQKKPCITNFGEGGITNLCDTSLTKIGDAPSLTFVRDPTDFL